MVFRLIIRFLTSAVLNERLVDKLAESKPIRSAARYVVFLINRTKSIAEKPDAEKLKEVSSNLEEKLKAIRDDLQRKMKQQNSHFLYAIPEVYFLYKMTRKKHSVIFIGNTNDTCTLTKKDVVTKMFKNFLAYFLIPPREIPQRILSSFIPPIFFRGQVCRVYVDFIGPCLAFLILNLLLHYGHAYKSAMAAVETPPSKALSIYATGMPILSYFLAVICKARIEFHELLALLGYGLYGHIFTIGFSLLLYNESSNVVFAVCLIVFSGLSTARIALVLLTAVPKPICRLLVCSLVSIAQILSLLFFHFVYMHQTFVFASHQ